MISRNTYEPCLNYSTFSNVRMHFMQIMQSEKSVKLLNVKLEFCGNINYIYVLFHPRINSSSMLYDLIIFLHKVFPIYILNLQNNILKALKISH